MDYTIGTLDNRQLHIRTYSPFQFRSFVGGCWKFRPLLLLSPIRWVRAIKERGNWCFWVRRGTNVSHRCYCPTGSVVDGRIVACGFGLTFWHSRFTGIVPCVCDKAMSEMFPEEEL